MGTVVEKFQYIEGTKQAIKKALKSKGVDVSDTDTFRSYAEKIKEIGSGSGGSSVAEYVITEVRGVEEYPKTSYLGQNWLFLGEETAYRNSNLEYQFYNQFDTGYGTQYAFDNDLKTECMNYSRNSPIYFKSNQDVLGIRFYSQRDDANYLYTHIFGTNNEDDQVNVGNMTLVGSYHFGSDTSAIWREVNINTQYKYYAVYWGTQDPNNAIGINIYEIKLLLSAKAYKCTLSSSNMTPKFEMFKNNYMQIVTQDWHNGSTIIPSQTLVFKPYEDGGCLVNYTDDGKAVNLKMYLMTSADSSIYVLAPDDDFTLDGYEGKTQVADLNIPAHIYFNGTDWVMGE